MPEKNSTTKRGNRPKLFERFSPVYRGLIQKNIVIIRQYYPSSVGNHELTYGIPELCLISFIALVYCFNVFPEVMLFG